MQLGKVNNSLDIDYTCVVVSCSHAILTYLACWFLVPDHWWVHLDTYRILLSMSYSILRFNFTDSKIKSTICLWLIMLGIRPIFVRGLKFNPCWIGITQTYAMAQVISLSHSILYYQHKRIKNYAYVSNFSRI